ncbi:hypothetical protein [Donghicola mangrovi]|uniref:Uncharacterized protein n=1 Tax=Donghicola mangrovi TaxID=2729614 RepID=A0A850QFY3_9RHOB|nr:hypothetical protein [Donghicola mangrovi]NVO24989.1 hypothetical protein [Donghicola mangrovi]
MKATDQSDDLVTIQLPLPFVHGLLALTHLLDGRVVEALLDAVSAPPASGFETDQQTEEVETLPVRAKRSSPILHETDLVASVLGQTVRGATLPDLFGKCVDLIHKLDPAAIEQFAEQQTHARRYVAKSREDIHFRSPHLVAETQKTESGWWISKNVSENQVVAGLRALADAAKLHFGDDIKFPSGGS